MGQDKFELFVKNKMDQYQSPIDTDDLWKNINKSMPSSATAVAGTSAILPWKWILGSVVVLSLVGAGLFYNQVNKYSSDLSAVPAIETKNTNLVSEISTQEANSAVGGDLGQSPKETKKSAVLFTENNTDNKQNVETEASPNSSVAKIEKTSVLGESPLAKRDELTTKTKVNSLPIVQPETPASTNTVSTTLEQNQYDESQAHSVSAAKYELPTTTINTNTKSYSVAEKAQNLRALVYDTKLMNRISGLENKEVLTDFTMEKPKKVVCPDFGGGRGNRGEIGLELQVIPFYSTPRFTALDAEGEEWQKRREETESYLEAFQVNLLGRYSFGNGLYLHGGIGYGQIDEKLQFTSENVSVEQVSGIPVIIIKRPGGVIDTIVGVGDKETFTSLNAKTYNYHRMVELPFALGFEFLKDSRIRPYVDFGGSVNLAVFRQGYIVVDEIDLISFDDTSRPIYKTSTGFKINGGAGIRYYMSDKMSLSVGPEIRYHRSNWLRDELSLEQRYLDVGLRLAAGLTF